MIGVDKLCLHYFELQKLPKTITADNGLELWLSLFNAETEEELKCLEGLEVSEVNQTIEAYRKITVTPEFREAERLRSKARHDEAQALYHAKLEEKLNFAQAMLNNGEPIDRIIKYTGLPIEKINSLHVQR